MAKTKGKANIAASNVPSQVEAVSGNDMIAESAPSESVEIEEAATTMVLDKPEEVDNKEETSDGPDESVEVYETEEKEDGLDEPVEVNDVEENENCFDKSENKDGLDKSEHGDKIEEPTDALDKWDEGDKEEETKEDGKEESLATDVPEGEEVEETDVTGEAKDNDKGENAPNKKTKSHGLDKSEHGDKIEEPTDVFDKSDEGDKEEETKEDGKEESLATDVPEGEEVLETNVTGEAKDNDKGENAPNKKTKSHGLDKSEHGDKIEEPTNVFDKSDEGDKEEETKEDGKEESLATDVRECEVVEETDVTGETKDNDKGENAPNKKTKRMRRRKKAATAAANDANKSSDADKQKTSAAEKDWKMAEETIEGGKDKSLATYVPEGEEVEKRDVTGEAKDTGKGENAPNKKAKRMRRRKKKNGAAGAANDASESNDADKGGTSAAEKESKMADGMGLIFMCNAKTKNDCFRYKVFGLPASKKGMVAKVYKGMRLFLFDIDLKLMYGIYKAADSGGYNIEPKAFESAFPSQVRFTVLKDCLPLPEEKFKAAIKGNYYGKKKFNCELSPEQVKNLCKLFQSVGKTSRKKNYGEGIRTEPEHTSSSRVRKTSHSERVSLDDHILRDRKRSRHERVGRDDSIPRDRKRSHCERVRWDDSILRDRKRSHHERVKWDGNIPRGQDVYARREAYASLPPRSLALPPPPLPPLPYAYVRPTDDYYYHEPLEHRDPYSVHREPMSREALYREPAFLEPMYREPVVREAVYGEPLSREAVYREPIPYREAVYPASLTPAAYAPPAAYYRY